jgi:hypothetical protein
MIVGEQWICWVRVSCSGDYVEYSIVEGSVVQFGRGPPTLWTSILPPMNKYNNPSFATMF